MANLHFEVDTTPMARSVDSVNGHVNGVTAAVTGMEAAVIATEREASQTICENVDKGFYVLVKFQISQKAVAAYSEMTTKQMTLFQLAKALEAIQRQMMTDFSMISRRYQKLFQSLNRALETRVKEMDRPAMHFAEIKRSLVFDKLKDSSALLISSGSETQRLTQTALSAKMKQKALATIQSLSGAVMEGSSYSSKVQSILQDEDVPDTSYCFLPVVFCSAESFLNTTESLETLYTSKAPLWQNTSPVITAVTEAKEDLSWQAAPEKDAELIKREFLALCEKEPLDSRVSAEVLRLFEQNPWEAPAK
jgi:hypothetical protein